MNSDALLNHLDHTPQPLRFGTSGRRGEVMHLTQLEIYINALAEIEYLQELKPEDGGVLRGDEFYFATDLRPSSTAYVAAQGGRGEIAQAVCAAITDAGLRPIYFGALPTPALTAYAIARRRGSIMVTGSHIPFDRNGYKVNTSIGELLKHHEQPINARVALVRERIYAQSFDASRFAADGRFKDGHRELPALDDAARAAYIARYVDFFGATSLAGLRLLAYQHSAVGRDLLVELLRALGAEVVAAGRSESFVPIDTENIDAEQLSAIQTLLDTTPGHFDAVVSTDGDSDRPLILGLDTERRARFFGGDLVGMVVAESLDADAVVVPISCNDAIDRGPLASVLEPKTRIGSPYVIAGMERARAHGKRRVCGWEANGGFLTGSVFERNGATLAALPTRDAMLPIIGVLAETRARGLALLERFAQLPARYSRAALLKNFPRPTAERIIARFTPGDVASIKADLETFFPASNGFSKIDRIDYTDGVRAIFVNGEVAHIRPSGNADELRIYAVADTQARADAIAALGVAEPDGILRQLERAVG